MLISGLRKQRHVYLREHTHTPDACVSTHTHTTETCVPTHTHRVDMQLMTLPGLLNVTEAMKVLELRQCNCTDLSTGCFYLRATECISPLWHRNKELIQTTSRNFTCYLSSSVGSKSGSVPFSPLV